MRNEKNAQRGDAGRTRNASGAGRALVRSTRIIPRFSAPVKGNPHLADLADQARAKAARNFRAAALARARGDLQTAHRLRRLGLLHRAVYRCLVREVAV